MSELIRLQIVSNSDSEVDQESKQKVKDAVIAGIGKDLAAISDIAAAKAYVSENLPKIQNIVDQTLQMNGYSHRSMVSFSTEAYDIIHYDAFSLPGGVYDCLQIILEGGEKQIQSDASGRTG